MILLVLHSIADFNISHLTIKDSTFSLSQRTFVALCKTVCAIDILQLTQTQMDFPFGTAVDATKIVESAYEAYQTVFYENFNWGVLENKLKWRLMEWDQVCLKH